MMKLYDMLDKGQISEIAEIKEYFLMLEREQIVIAHESGYSNVIIDRGKDGLTYYNETYKGGSNE